jgi:ABC-type multidrug transport system ATPase subunit
LGESAFDGFRDDRKNCDAGAGHDQADGEKRRQRAKEAANVPRNELQDRIEHGDTVGRIYAHEGKLVIKFERVGKRFRVAPGPRRKAGVVDALQDVTAEIEAGEVVAVVGPNGAGKSTLFSVLLGFLDPTAGEVTIGGNDPRAYMRKHGAGYLPERFRLPPEWRVRDVLRGFAGLERIDRSRADAVIAEFGLHEHGTNNVQALSHGMVQRVGLAQAVLAERALIVLDEPTEGLDAFWRVRFRDVIAQQRARGATVLIASHDLVELERLADRAVVLDKGTVREVISLRGRTDVRAYRVELSEAHPAFAEVFPGARTAPQAGTYIVEVTDVADLNRRLAALLSAGAAIVSVRPADTLEERVTRSTSGPA